MKVSNSPHPTWGGEWRVLSYRPNGAKGERIRENVQGFTEAQARAIEIQAQHGGKTEVASFPRLADVVGEYLAWAEKNLSEETIGNKTIRLNKHIIPALGQRRVQELTQRLLDSYGANMKPSVYLKDIHHISAMITWMIKRRYAAKMDWTPEQQQVKAKVKRLPRMEVAEQCICALPREDHRIMCRLMLYAGLRWNEVRSLRWENFEAFFELVDVTGRDLGTWERSVTVVARITKNGDEEIVAVPSNCHYWFDDNRRGSGYMFPGQKDDSRMTRIKYGLNKAGEVTGVRMTPHMFRHVSGTELYRRTKDIFRVMQHLRHKNLKDTMIYVRYAAMWQRESVETLVR
jgi:integrase